MIRIFSTITIVLMVLLFPPAVLALISNDAVPGQPTYPIKRALEAGILAVASVNPTTKAMFTVQRSERRFKEVSVLIVSGDRSQNVNQTLGEFIKQTRDAADSVKKIKDPVEKKQRTTKLKESIVQYKQGLQLQQKKISDEGRYVTPVSPSITQSPNPTSNPITPTVSQVLTTPVPTSFVPSPTHIPGLTPMPTQIIFNPSPTSVPNIQEPDCTDPNLSEAMKKALNCLENINEGLNADNDIPDTSGDDVPGAEEPDLTEEPEPQSIPTKEPESTIEPTLVPSPEEPPAVRQIRQRTIIDDSTTDIIITPIQKDITPTP